MTPQLVSKVGRLAVVVVCSSLPFTASVSAQSQQARSPEALSGGEAPSDDHSILTFLAYDLERSAERERERQAAAEALRAERAAAELRTKTESKAPAESIDLTTFFSQPLAIPVKGLSVHELDDNYGTRRDGGRRRHQGIDIFAPRGTEAVAACDGYIESIGKERLGGNTVRIRSTDGRVLYYAHLDRYADGIYDGMTVRQGDVVGYIGNTGNARRSSPHLHFAVIEGSRMVNPFPLLSDRSAATVLSGGFASSGQ